jgi:hypothetical protein
MTGGCAMGELVLETRELEKRENIVIKMKIYVDLG